MKWRGLRTNNTIIFTKRGRLKPKGVKGRSSGRVRKGTVLKVLLDPSTIEDPKFGY